MRTRAVERRRYSMVIGERMYNSAEIEALYRRFASSRPLKFVPTARGDLPLHAG
jgi:hypothetical protein